MLLGNNYFLENNAMEFLPNYTYAKQRVVKYACLKNFSAEMFRVLW